MSSLFEAILKEVFSGQDTTESQSHLPAEDRNSAGAAGVCGLGKAENRRSFPDSGKREAGASPALIARHAVSSALSISEGAVVSIRCSVRDSGSLFHA